MVHFVMDHFFQTAGKVAAGSSIHRFAEGTHKKTERRLSWDAPNNSERQPPSALGARHGRKRVASGEPGDFRDPKRTNALLTVCHGWASCHYHPGRVSNTGSVKKYRPSMNLDGLTFRRGGESASVFDFGIQCSRNYAREHFPTTADLLYAPASAMSDFQVAARSPSGASSAPQRQMGACSRRACSFPLGRRC